MFVKGQDTGHILSLNSVAAELAHKDAVTQAEFFDTFVKELNAICETAFLAESQIMAINIVLMGSTREALKALTYEEDTK